MQAYGPGVPRPGEAVGNSVWVFNGSGSNTTNTTATDVTGATLSITPTSAVNKNRCAISVIGLVTAGGSGKNTEAAYTFLRGATTIAAGTSLGVVSGGGTNFQSDGMFATTAMDSPQSTSSLTYKLQHQVVVTAGGSATVYASAVNLLVEEIMG